MHYQKNLNVEWIRFKNGGRGNDFKAAKLTRLYLIAQPHPTRFEIDYNMSNYRTDVWTDDPTRNVENPQF